jgi:cell division topological specificity factor
MSLFDYFRSRKPNTAAVAKERLQILVSHERSTRVGPEFLPELKQELLAVIRKYYPIELDQVKVQLGQQDDCSLLELDIVLPDHDGRTLTERRA